MHFVNKAIIAAAAVSSFFILPQLLQDPLPVTPAELAFCERMFGLGHTACFLYHKAKFFFEGTIYGATALGTLFYALRGRGQEEAPRQPRAQNTPPAQSRSHTERLSH